MAETIEVQLSNYQIEKATARLIYQRDAVRRLGFSRDSGFAAIASETLEILEERLARLLTNHRILLQDEEEVNDRAAR